MDGRDFTSTRLSKIPVSTFLTMKKLGNLEGVLSQRLVLKISMCSYNWSEQQEKWQIIWF